MPPSKPKPSEIAAEAKKTYIPFIRHQYPQWSSTSYLCPSESMVVEPLTHLGHSCRFAFYERDPVDLALDWAVGDKPVPVIMPANEKRPGGDWEAGVMSPEECLCRRSNLFATLTSPGQGGSNYPIPPLYGIYSENVVFRSPPPLYTPYSTYRPLPIISIPPVRRPKLNTSGTSYSFTQERDLMHQKIQCALRIAIYYNHSNLCIGTFGLGPGFRNPVEEVAVLWRDTILKEEEFRGRFHNVVFAFEVCEGAESEGGAGGGKGKGKSGKGDGDREGVRSDLEVFRHVFSPAVVHGLADLE